MCQESCFLSLLHGSPCTSWPEKELCAHSQEEVWKRLLAVRGKEGEAKLDIKEELELECKGWGKEWGLAKPSVVDGV